MSLTLLHSGWTFLLPWFLGRKTLFSLFSVFLIWCFVAKDPRRKSWWFSFPEPLAQMGKNFLRGWADQEDLGPPPSLYSTCPHGCESKAPFPSGSSFSPLDSSLPEDVPVFPAAAAATPVTSAVPTRYLVSPDGLRWGGRCPGSLVPSLGPRLVRHEEV